LSNVCRLLAHYQLIVYVTVYNHKVTCSSYLPIVDGPGGYLPKTPAELQSELSPNDTVPFIGGIMRDDGAMFAGSCKAT